MQAEPPANNTSASLPGTPKLLKGLTALLLVMFPVGIFIMTTDFGKGFLWTSALFLVLEAFIMLLVLSKLSTPLSSAAAFAVVLILSFLAEWRGVTTGFPFGNYSYSGILQPEILGVPPAISFAWFAVVSSSLVLTRFLLPGARGFTAALISASLVLATDILLEPFASFINGYWGWMMFKIPPQNFLSWFVIGFIFSLFMNKVLKWKSSFEPGLNIIAAIVFGVNVLNFSILNLVNGYYILTGIGLLIIGIIVVPQAFLKLKEGRKQ